MGTVLLFSSFASQSVGQGKLDIPTNKYEQHTPNSAQGGVLLSSSSGIKRDWKYKIEFDKGNVRSGFLNTTTIDDQIFFETVGCYTERVEIVQPVSFMRSPHSQYMPNPKAYIEVDHQAYLDHGGDLEATMSWTLDLFMRVQEIYMIHHILIEISEVFIWDTPDPYHSSYNPTDLLEGFGATVRDHHSGDVAMLWTTRSIGGGKAVFSGTCASYDPLSHAGPYAVVGDLSTSSQGLTYDWSTYIVAHELGHVFGVPHTHACQWGSEGEQALDNCYVLEGNCSTPLPSTEPAGVMSYCYLRERGVDFSVGLDTEPGTLAEALLWESSCITKTCDGQECDDMDDCTTGDRYDDQCNCIGTIIDLNNNSICDMLEFCPEDIIVDQMYIDSTLYQAEASIILSALVDGSIDTLFLSAPEVYIHGASAIDAGVHFEIHNHRCTTHE